MFEWWDVVTEQGARGAGGIGVRAEHEVVDDQLWAAVEEVCEGDLFFLAGGIEPCEGIWLGDFNHGELPAEFG